MIGSRNSCHREGSVGEEVDLSVEHHPHSMRLVSSCPLPFPGHRAGCSMGWSALRGSPPPPQASLATGWLLGPPFPLSPPPPQGWLTVRWLGLGVSLLDHTDVAPSR